MGKARNRRLKWLRKKEDFDSGYEMYTPWGTKYRKCRQCGDKTCKENQCPDCKEWICSGIHGKYCDC